MDVVDRLADVLALEGQLWTSLSKQADEVRGHAGAEAVAARLKELVERHRDALRARLAALGGVEREAPARMPHFSTGAGSSTTEGPAAVLHAWYSALNHLALAYGILHAVAHRSFDSQEEGNTADLAEEHLRAYAGLAQEIDRIISDVVVWELGAAGDECRCRCPSCGLGICLCAPHGTATINQAWRESTPARAGPGIEVRPPREGSPAAHAGLVAGDRIVAVDGEPLPTDLDTMTLQTAIKAHEPGTPVRLEVLRGSERLGVEVIGA